MGDETQLPGDIEFPTPPLRPAQLADPAGPGLTWLMAGLFGATKVTALACQSNGSDYLVRTDAAGAVLVSTWPAAHYVLAWATDKLTRDKILAEWPVDGDPPDRSTLQCWPTRAAEQGLICRSGSGYRGNAFRYWLAERAPLLFPGHQASEAEKQAWRDRLAAHEHALRERRASACPPTATRV